MKLETEAELVQNSALGAALLWAFVVEYWGQSSRERGPSIPLALPILPIVLHRESVEAFHGRNYEGGLELALAENQTLNIDLQERVEAMYPQTMCALNVAFGSGLLSYSRERGEILPLRKTDPFNVSDQNIREMMNTAKRLGYWFCTTGQPRLGALLRIHL